MSTTEAQTDQPSREFDQIFDNLTTFAADPTNPIHERRTAVFTIEKGQAGAAAQKFLLKILETDEPLRTALPVKCAVLSVLARVATSDAISVVEPFVNSEDRGISMSASNVLRQIQQRVATTQSVAEPAA